MSGSGGWSAMEKSRKSLIFLQMAHAAISRSRRVPGLVLILDLYLSSMGICEIEGIHVFSRYLLPQPRPIRPQWLDVVKHDLRRRRQRNREHQPHRSPQPAPE